MPLAGRLVIIMRFGIEGTSLRDNTEEENNNEGESDQTHGPIGL